MLIRRYTSKDVKALAELFYETVHAVNIRDYSLEQVNVWATGKVDLKAWDSSLLEHLCYVAAEDGIIVGFGDIDNTGYLDRLYVHKEYQGRGIATAICDRLESESGLSLITTHASISARPFFESRGYQVLKQQEVIRKGISLTNFVMHKQL